MEARTAHWMQKWAIPNTQWTITGYSRAAYRTGFYIPELDLLLDAGPQNFNKPTNIFITHTHGDHIANLPFTLIRDSLEDTRVFELHAPAEAERHLRKYISSLFEVNALMDESDMPQREWYRYHGYDQPTTFRRLLNKAEFEITTVNCDHAIPTIGCCFSQVKTKLKDEFVGVPGKDIAKLRKEGAVVTKEVIVPAFAFICDTSIQVLTTAPQILQFPYVFIECTFIFPEEIDNAAATKHIHWAELRPYVLQHASITFVLFHFSLRYKDEEILSFFEKEKADHGISNIKVWAGDTSICNLCSIQSQNKIA